MNILQKAGEVLIAKAKETDVLDIKLKFLRLAIVLLEESFNA